MLTLTSTLSDEPIAAEEQQETFAGKLVITKSRKGGFAIGSFAGFTDGVSPMKSQKSFAEVPWLVREVPTPSQFAW